MSTKKKITKADLDRSAASIETWEKVIEYHVARGKGIWFKLEVLEDALFPFDGISNGAVFSRVSEGDIGDFVRRWFVVIQKFNNCDGIENLFTAFLDIADALLNVGSASFSYGAFVGVYGVFRVALMRCLASRGFRAYGGKSVWESLSDGKRKLDEANREQDALKVRVDRAERSAATAKVLANGGRSKKDFWLIQYEVIKRRYIEEQHRSVLPGDKPRQSLSSIIASVKRNPELELDGEKIAIPESARAGFSDSTIRNRLIDEGVHKPGKHKPGAGGARPHKR